MGLGILEANDLTFDLLLRPDLLRHVSVLAEKFRNIVMNGLSLEGRRMKMAQTLRQSTRQ